MTLSIEALGSLPFEIRVRALTKRDLWKAADFWCERATRAERMNNAKDLAIADTRYNQVHDELDRRDREQHARDQRKLARLQRLAGVAS